MTITSMRMRGARSPARGGWCRSTARRGDMYRGPKDHIEPSSKLLTRVFYRCYMGSTLQGYQAKARTGCWKICDSLAESRDPWERPLARNPGTLIGARMGCILDCEHIYICTYTYICIDVWVCYTAVGLRLPSMGSLTESFERSIPKLNPPISLN